MGNAAQDTIFLVDDEKDNLELYTRALSRYRVRTFEHSPRALAAALVEPPTCMVVDYRMPGLTGVDLVRRCRTAGYEGAVLMVTAYSDLDEIVRAEQVDLIYRILPKPVRIARFVEQVELAIADSRFRAAIEGKRRHPRFSVPMSLEVFWGDRWQPCATRNVSLGGALLDWNPGARERRRIVLRVRHDHGVIESLARLVRASEDGTGVEFVEPPPSFRWAVGNVISRHRYGQLEAARQAS